MPTATWYALVERARETALNVGYPRHQHYDAIIGVAGYWRTFHERFSRTPGSDKFPLAASVYKILPDLHHVAIHHDKTWDCLAPEQRAEFIMAALILSHTHTSAQIAAAMEEALEHLMKRFP